MTASIASFPGLDVGPLQGYPQQYVASTHNTPGWRGTVYSKVSCLLKQRESRDWASNHWPLPLRLYKFTEGAVTGLKYHHRVDGKWENLGKKKIADIGMELNEDLLITHV